MRLRTRILTFFLAVLGAGVLSLAIALSYDAPCDPAQESARGAQSMRAIVHRCYGSPQVLALENIDKPRPADDEVLVKVHAAAVNPLDWYLTTGRPYIMRMDGGMAAPETVRLGVDYSGTVEAVGKSVTRFKPGDEVFGAKRGAFAEYVAVREDRGVVRKPANVSFEQSAAVPVAAITALQGLRDQGRLKPGQRVLINGASGGVGTFAVQIAKSMGAEVTGVCSTRNVEMVRSLGADRVVDYTREDFTARPERYDVILDNVGNHSFSRLRRVLEPAGVYVMVGGPKANPWLGPMGRALRAPMYSAFVGQEFRFFVSELSQQDLTVLADLMAAGKLTSVIDRRYPLSALPEAIGYLSQGHARGKVIITLE